MHVLMELLMNIGWLVLFVMWLNFDFYTRSDGIVITR